MISMHAVLAPDPAPIAFDQFPDEVQPQAFSAGGGAAALVTVEQASLHLIGDSRAVIVEGNLAIVHLPFAELFQVYVNDQGSGGMFYGITQYVEESVL
jgi:L-serine deaminase